jgi:hypothetical protein
MSKLIAWSCAVAVSLSAQAIAGPDCKPSGIQAICAALVKCLAEPLHPGDDPRYSAALRKAAREGDGNGISITGKAACLSFTETSGGRGGYQWDNWSSGCDSGNMRLTGCTAWKAFKTGQPACESDQDHWNCENMPPE